MSKGDPKDEQETPTGFMPKPGKPFWLFQPKYLVPVLCCCLTGGGMLTIFGNHISDAWSCGDVTRANKAELNQIKTIVWQDHLNIIHIGDKVGLQLDPPTEEVQIKAVLSTNTP
jgi:hypothetical protein